MTVRRRLLTLLGMAMCASLGLAANARAVELTKYTIDPHDTDPAILDTPTPPGTRGKHQVLLAPAADRVGRLLVFIPTGGPTNIPSEFTELGSEAARLGYHTILLSYRNEAPIAALPTAAQPGCGPGETAPVGNEDCAIQIRKEILTGEPESPIVNIDKANSIDNRLNKLLGFLDREYPADGWKRFVDGNGDPDWSQTVLAGSSLGAGQAALIAQNHEVKRVALLHGWVDAKHGWVTRDKTPMDHYFALIHYHDAFFARTCEAYRKLELTAQCPLSGFPLPIPATNPNPNPNLIENREPPFGTQIHVINLDPFPSPPAVVVDPWHASTTRDGWIAREADGTPNRKLVAAWRSVLGDKDADTWLDERDNCVDIPNPEVNAAGKQLDADRDETGDACDATPLGTPPVIVVPADRTVDATGPGGAIVDYSVSATDDLDAHPAVSCAPSSGSRFAIGTTSVTCGSTDSLGNTASATFRVTALGAKEQLANLTREVLDASGLSTATKAQLAATLRALIAGFDPNRPLQRALACLTLRSFAIHVRLVAPRVQADAWAADANRIRAVLGC